MTEQPDKEIYGEIKLELTECDEWLGWEVKYVGGHGCCNGDFCQDEEIERHIASGNSSELEPLAGLDELIDSLQAVRGELAAKIAEVKDA